MKAQLRPAIALAVSMALAAPASAATHHHAGGSLIEKAEAAVREQLKDPDSAKFSHVASWVVPDSDPPETVVCGLVNAKNSYGGYSGAEHFSVTGYGQVFPAYTNVQSEEETENQQSGLGFTLVGHCPHNSD